MGAIRCEDPWRKAAELAAASRRDASSLDQRRSPALRREPSACFTLCAALEGGKRALPLAFGVAVYGFLFGATAGNALSLEQAAFMSFVVFAGSSQLATLDFWTTGRWFLILFTTVLINLRHLLMGATLWRTLQGISRPRACATAFFLGDESWTLALDRERRGVFDAGHIVGAGASVYIGWTVSTLLGLWTGSMEIGPSANRSLCLDTALPAALSAMLVGGWQGRMSLLPCAASGVLSVALAQNPGWNIIAACAVGLVIAWWTDVR